MHDAQYDQQQNSTLQRFVRAAVVKESAYPPELSLEQLAAAVDLPPERVVKLNQNENPYGPSLRVQEALAAFDRYQYYPDAEGRAARALLGGYVGMPAERIFLSNGVAELLDLLYLLTIEPGDEVIVAPPTFDLAARRAALFGATVVQVPRRQIDFSLDLAALRRAVTPRTKLIMLVSPNNPTGNLLTADELVQVLALGPLVVLDEAYAEFATRSLVPLAREFDNLIILRSFSIWAGLAGLRLGYGIMPRGLLPYLRQVRPPFSVNVAALLAVEATFEDLTWVRSGVVRLRVERGRLFRQLRKLNIVQPLPSEGNFLLCRVLRGDAATVQQRLAELGVMVRGYPDELANYLRISVGRPEDTDVLVKALLAISERL